VKQNNTLETLIALIQGMIADGDANNGARATLTPTTNAKIVNTSNGVFASLLTNIAKALRVSKANYGRLETALMYAFQGVSRRDIEQNRTSQYFVSRTAGKWISNAGGMKAFREHARRLYATSTPTKDVKVVKRPRTQMGVPTITTNIDLVNMCVTYFHSRVKAGTGFVTELTLIGQGVYKGVECAIVQKGSTSTLYAVGNLFGKGVCANKGKKVVGAIVDAPTFTKMTPRQVFVPTKD